MVSCRWNKAWIAGGAKLIQGGTIKYFGLIQLVLPEADGISYREIIIGKTNSGLTRYWSVRLILIKAHSRS